MTIALAIHGGCGTLPKAEMTEAEWAEARADLARSLRAGWAILAKGGSAVDAVEAAVVVMEESPHFNAGHGAALTEDATHELDAAIMDGATLAAGAVCTARAIRLAASMTVSGRSICTSWPLPFATTRTPCGESVASCCCSRISVGSHSLK